MGAPASARCSAGAWLGIGLIATLLFAVAASAQDQAPLEPTATNEAGNVQESSAETGEPSEIASIWDTDIEEFVVYGQPSQSLVDDVTISVVGFDMETLRLEGIKDIRDLSNFTPSLEIKSAFAASNPTLYIRGVGLDDFNANAASAVSIYQDGVYMQSPTGQLFQFYDVEAVEVLRGPQGTLYRNASAGAILLQSVRPSDEYTAYLTNSIGNYGLVEVEGAVGGPIVPEMLSFRLSGTWGIRDGITKNRCAAQAGEPLPVPPPCNQELQDGTRVVDPGIAKWTNDVDAWAARGQLLYTVPLREGSMEWLLNVHGGENNSRAYQYQHRGVRLDPVTEEPTRIGGTDRYGYKDRDGGDPFAGEYDIDGPEDIKVWGTNLKGTWLFGDDDAYKLESLTAYEWNDRYTLENTDAGPKFGLKTTYENSAFQWSQQFDLRGPIKQSKFGDGDWLLGVYFLEEDLDVSNFYNQIGDADLLQEYNQDMWNFAPYARVEYRLQPGCEPVSCDFTLLAGVRFNVERKVFDTGVTAAFGSSPSVSTLVSKEGETWTGWSGGVTLTWNVSEDLSLFGKYSRGWKGGHFNGGAVSAQDIITGVDPEIVDSFEGGLRYRVDWSGSSYWADGRLKFDVQGFYYDYQDLQVFIIEQTERGFPITKLVNATDAEVYGLELDIQLVPIPGLDINYHAAWVESEYEDFVVSFPDVLRFPGPCPTCPPTFITVFREFDYSGNSLIASPRFSMTGSIQYAIPLPGRIYSFGLGTLSPRFSFSWKEAVVYDPCGGRGTRCNFEKEFFGQEPFWVFNGALTWSSDNEMISVSGWVRNFLDEHYKTQSFDLTRGARIILDAYADPRTYGVTATFSL